MDLNKKLTNIIDWLRTEFTGIRTGQATPAILDSIKIDSYGSRVPLVQVGSVNIEDARTLRISVWDKGSVNQIEQAIRDANLGLGLVTDSSGIRVTFPELTGERRTQLIKLAGTKFEEARVKVKAVRDEEMKSIDKQQKDKELGEDESRRIKDLVQKQIEEINNKLEDIYKAKEKEINS